MVYGLSGQRPSFRLPHRFACLFPMIRSTGRRCRTPAVRTRVLPDAGIRAAFAPGEVPRTRRNVLHGHARAGAARAACPDRDELISPRTLDGLRLGQQEAFGMVRSSHRIDRNSCMQGRSRRLLLVLRFFLHIFCKMCCRVTRQETENNASDRSNGTKFAPRLFGCWCWETGSVLPGYVQHG